MEGELLELKHRVLEMKEEGEFPADLWKKSCSVRKCFEEHSKVSLPKHSQEESTFNFNMGESLSRGGADRPMVE